MLSQPENFLLFFKHHPHEHKNFFLVSLQFCRSFSLVYDALAHVKNYPYITRQTWMKRGENTKSDKIWMKTSNQCGICLGFSMENANLYWVNRRFSNSSVMQKVKIKLWFYTTENTMGLSNHFFPLFFEIKNIISLQPSLFSIVSRVTGNITENSKYEKRWWWFCVHE